MTILFISGLSLIGVFVIICIYTLIKLIIIRFLIEQKAKKTRIQGMWSAGTYIIQPPLPVALKSKDQTIKSYEKSHNKVVAIFWFNVLTLLLTVLLLNLGE